MRNLYVLLFISLALFNSLFAQTKLKTDAFIKAFQAEKKAQLIDVRTATEYQAGHIPNAKNINWNDRPVFDEGMKKLNKKKPVFVYCLSGGRSAQAAAALTEQGFKVFELQGGWLHYEQESNAPKETDAKEKTGLSMTDFEAIKKANKFVLVDFTAVWCGPCQEIKPLLAKLDKDKSMSVKVTYIDADVNKDLLKILDVQAIPRLQLFKFGELVWSHTGTISESDLYTQLKKYH